MIKLVGTNQAQIIQETLLLLNNPKEYQKMSKSVNPYGDGNASRRIQLFLEKAL